MARYDSEGYRADGRRQILGYSRAVQGGADEARARATMRREEVYNPALKAANQRARNVMMAKRAGTFDQTREMYNEAADDAGMEMDQSGTIQKKPKSYLKQEVVYAAPAKQEDKVKLLPSYQGGQSAVDMTTSQGLLDMARKARRRGTMVIP